MRSPEASGYARLAEVEAEARAKVEQEEAQQAAITEAYSDEAMRAEADAMNEQHDQRKEEQHAGALLLNEQYDKSATRFATEVAALNSQAEIDIFGSNGRTEGLIDPNTGEPLQKPVKGIIETMRENPRHGKTQAERDTAADEYRRDILQMVDEGLDISQAKVVMELRAQHTESTQSQEQAQRKATREAAREQEESNRQKIAEYERKLSILRDQYVANGHGEKEAEGLALARLTPPDVSPVEKTATKSGKEVLSDIDEKRNNEAIKKRVQEEGIYTLDESKNPRKPSVETEVVIPPVPPKLTDEVLATLPPMPPVPTGAENDWAGWKSSQEGFNTPPSTRKPTPPKPEDPSMAETTEIPKVEPGTDLVLFEGVRKGREAVEYEPKNLRQRLGDRFRTAKRAIADKYHGAAATIANLGVNAKEYFADDEKGKRRKITGAVVGVIAVGAAGYGAYKFGVFSGGGEHNGDTSTAGVGSGETTHAPTHTGELGAGDQVPDHSATPEGSTGSSGGKDALLDKPKFSSEASRTITLGQEGDTVWGQSASFLEANGIDPTDENIDRVKDAILEHYNISEIEATQLATGREFTIPQEVLEDLLRSSQ